MLAESALKISVMHRDYDEWIWSELDTGLKGLLADGKTSGNIEIREPEGLPCDCQVLFHNICMDCFKRWGYKIQYELFPTQSKFILSWGTPDYGKLCKVAPELHVEGWRPLSEEPSTDGYYLVRDSDGKWDRGEWKAGTWRCGELEPVQWAILGELYRVPADTQAVQASCRPRMAGILGACACSLAVGLLVGSVIVSLIGSML